MEEASLKFNVFSSALEELVLANIGEDLPLERFTWI